jgi:thioredoxin-related protein
MAMSSYSNKIPVRTYTLLVFQGSDWCLNCRRLEENILSETTFISFLKANHITLNRVDFPQRKVQDIQTQKNNEFLAERYRFEGDFPTLILSRTDTLLYKKIHYNKKQDSKALQDIILTKLNLLK